MRVVVKMMRTKHNITCYRGDACSLTQAELDAARKFLYHEMGYRSRSEQLTKTSEINLDYQEVVRSAHKAVTWFWRW